MCPPGYHHNDFVATHALGHMMHGWIVSVLYPCLKTLVTISYFDSRFLKKG